MASSGKVLYISHYYWPPHFGGELRIAIERLETLVQKGYTVKAFTSGVNGYPASEVLNGIEIRRSPRIGSGRVAERINRLLYWIWIYFQLLLERNVQVVHVEVILGVMGWINPFVYGNILLGIAKLKGAKTIKVHSLASNDQEAFVVSSRPEHKFFQKVDTIVSVSPFLHEGVKKQFPEKAKLCVCGIRNDVFQIPEERARKEFRAAHGIQADDVIFTFLGSFEYRKGLDMIVNTFVKNIDRQNWKLWLIGPYKKSESPYVREEEVAELIKPLEILSDRVEFWGKIDDRIQLAQILGASDVFLFPTRREGFGLAPLEAMASGLPVIVTRIPGITDLANVEGETGFYIELNDQDLLEKRMIQLAEDPELRKSFGLAGAVKINQGFAWKDHVEKWERIYFD